MHSQTCRPDEQPSVCLQVEANQSTTSYQDVIPRKKCVLPKAVYGVASIMLMLVTLWVVVSLALDAEAAAKASKASKASSHDPELTFIPTMPTEAAAPRKALRKLLAAALRASHVSSAVPPVPSEVAFATGSRFLPGSSLARPQRQASTPVMSGDESDGTVTFAKLGNRVDKTLVKGINGLDKLGKQLRQSVEELRDRIEDPTDRLSGTPKLDKLGPLAVRDRHGNLDVNPLLDPYGKLRGRGFVDNYADRMQQQLDEKRRKRNAGSKALDKLGQFAVRDRDGNLDVNPLLDPYGKLRGRGFIDKYKERFEGQPGSRVTIRESSYSRSGSAAPKIHARVFDSRTDQDGKTSQNEFTWGDVVGDQLYLQCNSVLDQDDYRPADIERMLSGLSQDAMASNPEAQRSLNQLAELSIRLTEIEQSSSPGPEMLDEASDIRNEIRSWARSQEQYFHSLPAPRRGALPGSWPAKNYW